MKDIGEIELLLDEERAALASPNLEQLAHILQKKEILLERLARERIPNLQAHSLRAKAQHNQALMDSTLAGLRHAAKAISEQIVNRSEISVYTQLGKKRTFHTQAKPALEKKA